MLSVLRDAKANRLIRLEPPLSNRPSSAQASRALDKIRAARLHFSACCVHHPAAVRFNGLLDTTPRESAPVADQQPQSALLLWLNTQKTRLRPSHGPQTGRLLYLRPGGGADGVEHLGHVVGIGVRCDPVA